MYLITGEGDIMQDPQLAEIRKRLDRIEKNIEQMGLTIAQKIIKNHKNPVIEVPLLGKAHMEYLFKFEKEDIENLFKMTPYYYKTSREDAEKLLSLSE